MIMIMFPCIVVELIARVVARISFIRLAAEFWTRKLTGACNKQLRHPPLNTFINHNVPSSSLRLSEQTKSSDLDWSEISPPSLPHMIHINLILDSWSGESLRNPR